MLPAGKKQLMKLGHPAFEAIAMGAK